jgi:hypothetical protein
LWFGRGGFEGEVYLQQFVKKVYKIRARKASAVPPGVVNNKRMLANN